MNMSANVFALKMELKELYLANGSYSAVISQF